jgi:hypothetical protein
MSKFQNSSDGDQAPALSQTGVPRGIVASPAKPNATGCAFPTLVLMTYLIAPVAGSLLGVVTDIKSSIVFLFVPGCLAAWAGWIIADRSNWPASILKPKWIYVGGLSCWTLLVVGISAKLFDRLAPMLIFMPVMQFVLFRIGIRTKIAWTSSRRHKPWFLSRLSE